MYLMVHPTLCLVIADIQGLGRGAIQRMESPLYFYRTEPTLAN